MIELGTALVVDDSDVYRKLLATLLRPYASSVLTAKTVAEARAILDSPSTIDVVVCDVVLEDEDGFEILEHVAASELPLPRVIMVSGFRDDAGPERAARLGAAGYLRKPTRLREIAQVLQSATNAQGEMNSRVRCAGVAYVLEPGPGSQQGEHLAWDLYNLGPHGAFLETKGPLPVGEELDLLLDVGDHQARVRARVVRVQEPSWLNVGGVGISFIDVADEARAAIDAAIAEAGEREGATVESGSPLDPDMIAEIRALDPRGREGLLARVAEAYGAVAPGLVEDLQQAHQKGDADAMAAVAHSLRSSCCSLGALHLAELCREIEALGRAGEVAAAAPLLEALGVESERVGRAVAAL